MIVAPDSSRQFQTRSTNSSRPSSSRVRFDAREHALHHVLRRDARVVGAADPERLAALHPAQADDHVLHRAVERVAHVQRARDVGRRHGDHERLARVVRLDREGAASPASARTSPARPRRGRSASRPRGVGGRRRPSARYLGPRPAGYVRMRRSAAISSRKRSGARSAPTPPTRGRRRSARSRASRFRGTASSACAALEEAPQRGQLGVAQAAHVPGGQLAATRPRRPARRLRAARRGARLAHDERARREVAEALVVAASRRSRPRRRGTCPGGCRRAARRLRSALARNVTGEPSSQTTRRLLQRLPGVRPPARSSNATG